MKRDELLERYAKGERNLQLADLSGANLRGTNLSGANLRYANLRGTNLSGADLSGANLRYLGLQGADLRNADLSGADLRYTDFRRADLSGADLRDANLYCANLQDANLKYANLRDADLQGANLPSYQIPQEGELIVYKASTQGVIKLRVPPEAKRTASLVGRKCRAEYVEVLEAPEDSRSLHDGDLCYPQGAVVKADTYDPNPLVECTGGIHFFLTREEAERWLPW